MSRDFIKKTRDWLLDIQTEVAKDLAQMPVKGSVSMFLFLRFTRTMQAFIAAETVHDIATYNKDGLYIQRF